MGNKTYSGIELKSNEELVIRTRARGTKPMFLMIGNPVKVKDKLPGFPLLETILKFNKEEQWFFNLLLEHLNIETNECDISSVELTGYAVPKVSKAYGPLKEMKLVYRVRKNVYLINPTAIIPPLTYEDVQKRWDEVINK